MSPRPMAALPPCERDVADASERDKLAVEIAKLICTELPNADRRRVTRLSARLAFAFTVSLPSTDGAA